MAKLLAILLVGLILEATGVVWLSKGLKQIGDVDKVCVAEVLRILKQGLANPYLLLGVLFEALFFGCLLVLMARAEISVIWPLTALGFVLTTLAARFILHEQVPALRWAGVVLIMVGAALVSWSEQSKPPVHLPASAPPSTVARPPQG